uniref:Uncharacterized protein n=1 Tax=Anguilla anguilla TaxID=7936 RepID=A0A0E9PUX4_ANGAN
MNSVSSSHFSPEQLMSRQHYKCIFKASVLP